MASGTDDFTVPTPLQEGGIDVYECLEEERKGVRSRRVMLFMGKHSSEHKHNILGFDTHGNTH